MTSPSASSASLSSSSTVKNPSEDSGSIYFLGSHDFTGSSIVGEKLNGSNYLSWCKGIEMALNIKNKMKFIDGSLPMPSEQDPVERTCWTRANNLVLSWIMNSVTPEIHRTLLSYTSACAVWNELRTRYARTDGSRVFHLRRSLATISQVERFSILLTSFGTFKFARKSVRQNLTLFVCQLNHFACLYSVRNMEKGLLVSSEEGNLKGRICEESKKIWRVALPSVISRVSSFGTIVVTQSYIGHISSVDLAGYALVQTLGIRFVNGILIGMSSATETLCGQAYGAKQYHMMGIFLQRSWLVDLVTLTILLPIFFFATSIFKLLGEDDAVSQSAGNIALWFIPFSYSLIFSLTIQMYLQAQQKNRVIAWLSILQFAIHVLLSWLFVSVMDYGVRGAMVALSVSSWFLVAGEFVYVLGGWCPDSWKGFSLAALKDIYPVVKLSISSGVMLCLEMWYYAILVLLAGHLKNAEVAISAFSICLNLSGWEFMISLGLLGASVVRVANELGRGDAKAIKFSLKVLLATASIIQIICWALCLIFGNKLGYLFSNEKAVAESVGDLSILLSFTILLNSIYPIFSGAAIGAGLQTTVAVVIIVCFYLIGIPIGLVLGYVLNYQVKGLWIGMICGVVTETLALTYMMWRTNWDEEVTKATMRLKRWYLETPEQKPNHA